MRALLIVDAQNDFMPGGSLAVERGDEIIPVINKLLPEFELVIFTKDWHPMGMEAFASSYENKKPFDTYTTKDGIDDILWPDHCVQDTPGAMLHKDIKFDKINGEFYIFKKGTNKEQHPYSGFGGTDLGDFLREKSVNQVFITGLATDYCVRDTAIDATFEEFNTTVILDATRSINPDLDETLKMFKESNVKLIESWQFPLSTLNFS